MGSSEDTNNNNKGIDASVGGLVWVRRRNGSWWPGQILDPEDLPDSSLVSPKLGTPVKLLGREDASVDWYNLEKSKRVKSFRCGEYDECIEKAKAAAANVSRKVVKYARREDAIIHALEIESARLSNNGHQELCSKTDLKNPKSPKEMADASTSNDESDSVLGLSRSGVSFENPNHLSSSKEQSACETRFITPNDSEDDGNEGVKRMKGLNDLGVVGVASSFKRKRSQVAYVHEFLKKKKREKTLAKVMENTMVTVPIMCEELTVPAGLFLLEAYDSKAAYGLEKNPSIVINNSDVAVVSCETGTLINGYEVENQCRENGYSDKLFDVPLVVEEDHSAVSPILSCGSQKPRFIVGPQSCQSSQLEGVPFRIEEPNEPGYISYKDAETNRINQKTEKGATEWQLKGKRNSRHTGKSKKQEESDVKDRNGKKGESPFAGCLDTNGSSPVKCKPISEIQLNELRGWTRYQKETRTKVPITRLLPYRHSRFTVNPKYDPSDFSVRHHLLDNSLYNVNVEVQSSSCRPHHVPYISLMSKLSGRPIVGHPLTVEVVEKGFCDDLMSNFSDQCEMNDDIEEEKMSDLPSGIHYESTSSSVVRRMPTKHHHGFRSPKCRRNGVLSKKMRKLSSLTCSNRQMDEEDEEEENPKARMEKLKGPPAVACVPLNIVFSRINAAFSRSLRPAIRRLLPDNS